MAIQMTQVAVNRIFLDNSTPADDGSYEFTMDCGAVYFGAVYDSDGALQAIDQYFYCSTFSRDDMDDAMKQEDLLTVDTRDFSVKAYMLTKSINEKEWLRFHAVVPQEIDIDYFFQKYIGE